MTPFTVELPLSMPDMREFDLHPTPIYSNSSTLQDRGVFDSGAKSPEAVNQESNEAIELKNNVLCQWKRKMQVKAQLIHQIDLSLILYSPATLHHRYRHSLNQVSHEIQSQHGAFQFARVYHEWCCTWLLLTLRRLLARPLSCWLLWMKWQREKPRGSVSRTPLTE